MGEYKYIFMNINFKKYKLSMNLLNVHNGT